MIKLILIAALLFVSGASMAQKVVVGANGEAIIDNRAMPANTITTKKKALITDATNSTMGTNDLNNLTSAESNKTVSHYFEVQKTFGGYTNWFECLGYCRAYKSGDGNDTWRSPTQRELYLIWVLQASLIKKFTDFKTASLYFWSATELLPGVAISLNFGNGTPNVTPPPKTAGGHVRCVRDLDPQ